MKKILIISIIGIKLLFGSQLWVNPMQELQSVLKKTNKKIDAHESIIRNNTENQKVLFKMNEDNSNINKELLVFMKSLNERIILLESENKALRKDKIKNILKK